MSSIEKSKSQESLTTNINVSGMSCGGCAATVERALSQIQGVAEAEVNLSDKSVLIRFTNQPIDAEIINLAVQNAGYEVIR